MMTLSNVQAISALKSATLGINAGFASCGRTVDPDTALDLAQESICNVIESFDPSKATANGVDGYSYRVGYREALDYLRGRKSGGAQRRHDGEDSITAADDDGNVTDLEVPSPWPSPFDQLATAQRNQMLQSEIDELPEAQQRALQSTIDDETPAEADRNRFAQNKMRAINTIVANLPKSMRTGVRSRAKGQKRSK
jgi:DNA-directed RNA polymerase specialized sigma24 family protein